MLRRLPHPSCRSVACATWTVTFCFSIWERSCTRSIWHARGFEPWRQLCGRMTEEVKETIDGKNTYIGYIDGYLSGFNLLTPGKANFFEGTDPTSRYKFVLKYCEENPLDAVATAIHKLILRYKSPLINVISSRIQSKRRVQLTAHLSKMETPEIMSIRGSYRHKEEQFLIAFEMSVTTDTVLSTRVKVNAVPAEQRRAFSLYFLRCRW